MIICSPFFWYVYKSKLDKILLQLLMVNESKKVRVEIYKYVNYIPR